MPGKRSRYSCDMCLPEIGASGPVKLAKAKAGSPPAAKKAETKKPEAKAAKAAPKTTAKSKKTVSITLAHDLFLILILSGCCQRSTC